MKLNRPQTLEWFSLQLAIAVGGAVAAIINPWLGLLLGGASLPLNFFLLQQGWRHRDTPETTKPLADAVAVAGLLMFFLLYFQNGLVVALMALLYGAMLAMSVQLNNHRKFFLAQTVSFVFVLAGAAEAKTGGYLLVLAAYCIVAAFALTELWLDRGDDKELAGPPLRQRSVIALVTMVLAAGIYLLMPRLTALNIGGHSASAGDFYHNESWLTDADGDLPDDGKGGYDDLKQITDLSGYGTETQESYRYTGFNETFHISSPQRSGTLPMDTVIARMKAPRGAYLKVRSFDTFDGLSWQTSDENIERKFSADHKGEVTVNETLAGNFLHTISIEETIPAWLPLAGEPVTLWVPSSVIALDQFDQPLLPGVLLEGTTYTADSLLELRDQRPVARGPAPRKADLQLPTGFDPAIRRLAQQVARGDSVYERAVALEHHLRTSYRYSFESALVSQDRTPLSEFLFETHEGHCEYFASAMTVMLRSVGVPARLVTGFSATVRNPLTGYFDIRAIDGHAWTEAWIDGRWVTFEPTAYYALPRPQESRITAEQIREYAESIQHRTMASGDGDYSVSAVLSHLWMVVYSSVILALSWVKWVIVTLWWLWGVFAVAAVIGLSTRRKWWPWWLAWRSQQRIAGCPVASAEDTLHFCFYHLQRMARVRASARERGESFAQWLVRIEGQVTISESMRALAAQSEQVFYHGEAVAPADIRRLATEASSDLWLSLRQSG